MPFDRRRSHFAICFSFMFARRDAFEDLVDEDRRASQPEDLQQPPQGDADQVKFKN
jgi:hypothetical protein